MATETPRLSAPVRRPGRPRGAAGPGADVAERLLDAATELTAEQGFDACGLREIAARAEVSSGMIAYYFGDRAGLHDAMCRRMIERLTNEVRGLLEREGDSADRLDAIVRLHVNAIAREPALPQFILRELLAGASSKMSDAVQARPGAGALRMLVEWIEEEQAQGLLRAELDARLVALSVASLAVFPYLVLPLVGAELGLDADAADRVFGEQLIEHNRRLLLDGLRTPGSEHA